jgi:hypothetical protein
MILLLLLLLMGGVNRCIPALLLAPAAVDACGCACSCAVAAARTCHKKRSTCNTSKQQQQHDVMMQTQSNTAPRLTRLLMCSTATHTPGVNTMC